MKKIIFTAIIAVLFVSCSTEEKRTYRGAEYSFKKNLITKSVTIEMIDSYAMLDLYIAISESINMEDIKDLTINISDDNVRFISEYGVDQLKGVRIRPSDNIFTLSSKMAEISGYIRKK